MNGFASTSCCCLRSASLYDRILLRFELLLCFELYRVLPEVLPPFIGVLGLLPTVPIVLFRSTTDVFGTNPLNAPGVPDLVLVGSEPTLFLL